MRPSSTAEYRVAVLEKDAENALRVMEETLALKARDMEESLL
jgi:hypothetical protein